MTRTVIILLAALILVLPGCKSDQLVVNPDDPVDTIEQNQKQKLLEQIDRKYESPEAHYQLGRLYYKEGQLTRAQQAYQTAIGFMPVHYGAQAGLVRVLVDCKQADRAKIIAENYITQTAVSARASVRLGKAFQNEDLGDYAVSCYHQAAGLAPDSAEPYRLLGFYYLSKGDKVRAEQNLRRSFEIDPYQPEVSAELGRIGVPVQTPRKTN